MTQNRPPRVLQAEAGPRIHAPGRAGRDEGVDFGGGELLDQRLHRRARSGAEAAEVLLLQLRDDPLALLPWSLDREDPVRHLGPGIGATFALPAVLFLLGVPWFVTGAVFVALGLATLRLLSTPARRTAVAAREIQSELEHGACLQDIHAELEELVREAPELDAARMLLAQARLEQGDVLSALMQLAPLRDRHPDEGAVVVLAALAYARKGAYADAVRMLDALHLESLDAWGEQVARFHELCSKGGLAGARASSDDMETDL